MKAIKIIIYILTIIYTLFCFITGIILALFGNKDYSAGCFFLLLAIINFYLANRLIDKNE